MKAKRPPHIPASPLPSPPPVPGSGERRSSGLEGVAPASESRAAFDSEPPTRQKNVTASVYQSLLSVFDDMTAKQRMEFVEFAARYAALDPGARHALIELLPEYSRLSEPQRAGVQELVTQLAATRAPQVPRQR